MPLRTLLSLGLTKSGLGLNGQREITQKRRGANRAGGAAVQSRVVPRAAASEEAVLLHVSNHSDGTVTYSFGAYSERIAHAGVAVVETHVHHHAVGAAAAPATVGASAAEAEAPAASTTAVVDSPPPSPSAAVQQLDRMLHLTPKVGSNGAANNGHENGSNAKPHASHNLLNIANEAVAAEKQMHRQSAGRRVAAYTGEPSSSARAAATVAPVVPAESAGPLDYSKASVGEVLKVYSIACDAGRLEDALTVVKESIRAARQDVLKRLKHFKFLRPAQRQRNVRRALRFVQLLPRQYVDSRTYNMLLSVCAEAGDVKNALRAADMLRGAGLRMDTILYTNLIKTCAAAGDADHAFQVYNEMRSAGVKTEKHVYTTLIHACAEQIAATPATDRRTQLVLLERAFELAASMQSSRMQTDAAVWNALVTTAGRAGQLQRAFDVLDEMMGAGNRPNARTYASLIDACARTGDKALALRVYAKSRREGFGDTLMIYSSAINACVKGKEGADLAGAMEVYADMQRAGVTPDSALFGALMMAAGRAGDLPLALELEAEMQREGLEPCSGTESALLTVHLHNDKLVEAQAIYRRLRAAGVAPHIHALNALISAHGRALRLGDVVSIVCDMVDAGITPDAYTYAAVLNACQRSDECELALDVYRLMRVQGVRVDEMHASVLMKMCYNRLRQTWQPGGYPPRAAGTMAPSSPAAGGRRAQERAKLLAALTPLGRKANLGGDVAPADVPWQAHAFHIYREAMSAGVKPTLSLLNIMFSCLRVPWSQANPSSVPSGQAADLALLTQRLHAGLPLQRDSAALVQGKIGIESVYHSRAISIMEDAIVSGLVPAFKVDGSPPFDLRAMPPAVAEVYMLTVVSALQRQVVEARRELKHRVVFLVPRYDGRHVFRPSFLSDSESEDEWAVSPDAIDAGRRGPASASPLADGYESDHDVADLIFNDGEVGAAEEAVEGMADDRTGLGVAGTMRRLRLWAREYSPEGLIVVEPKDMTRWAKMIQREVEKRSASALALQKPYGQAATPVLGVAGLRHQSSSIRSKGL